MSDPIVLADELFRALGEAVERVTPLLGAARSLPPEGREVFVKRLSALVDARVPPDRMLILKFLLSVVLVGVFPQSDK